jgi:hypothetical protein
MPWQDWVFSIGGFIVLASMVPTVRGHQKPALSTSIITFVLVGIFAFTMATLGLWLSAVANAGMSLTWGVLALQRYRQTSMPVIEQIEDEIEDVLHAEDEPGSSQEVGATP